ncbi:actin-like ATPase domain-containing protein [Sporormia fimetaria CBS 119925]|uniref:Phosphotransferase n=1 Tax=Sporormia fimetaria CBS 119925 TaxID=1340428 RepID=A0A6A6VI85_9PLEO|nr:actin-like ATPase domain-containing protein [Sporormia fimetaria CBS 119925]
MDGCRDLFWENEGTDEKALASFTGFINESTLLDLAGRFSDTYRDLAKTSTDHFLVTPVTALPSGKEKGKFLSIDVGGTNLRVGIIELLGEVGSGSQNGKERVEKIKRSHDKSWPIEDHMKMDKAEDLFAWIGDCIAEVITEAIQESGDTASSTPAFGDELPLGITFSFPMAQTNLSEATLLPMGKGFAITSNLNLGNMLLAGYSRHLSPTPNSSSPPSKPRLPRIRIAAITNDTVATFVSLSYAVKSAPHSRVAMGLIVGTGTNATVPMPPSSLHPKKQSHVSDATTVVINTEWTIRGTDKPLNDLNLKTKWDHELDANSEAPGFQPFEYMTAGRYLGEIVRLAFVDLTSVPDANDAGRRIPNPELPDAFKVKNGLPTRFLSEVIASNGHETRIMELLEEKWPSKDPKRPFWNQPRVGLLRDLELAVQMRSSALIAAACVGLLDCVGDIRVERQDGATPLLPDSQNGGNNQKQEEELVIAYAGGTISQYPEWKDTCQKWIDKLVAHGPWNKGKKVVLREALDGGIVGAGVLAGMTTIA